MTLLHFIGYLASVTMGVALGITGGGGSILTVPILVYLFGVSAIEATTYSLSIVGLIALWGTWRAYKTQDLHLKTAIAFGVPGVCGVIFSRKVLLPNLPANISFFNIQLPKDTFLLVVFSVLMIAVSYSMIRTSYRDKQSPTDNSKQKISPMALVLIGCLIGVLAGFVGAGGGFLIVPALSQFAHMKMRNAVGTSLFVIALQSLLGVFSDPDALRQFDLWLFVSIAVLGLIGMTLGTKIRDRVPGANLKRSFGFFVLFMGLIIFLQEVKKGLG